MSDPLVFVSFSHAVSALAKRLAADLHEAGAKAWLDQQELGAGARAEEQMQQALEDSDAYVLFLSPDPSPLERREWSEALKQSWEHPEKLLIPVLLSGEAVPGALSDRQAVRVDPETGEGVEEIVELISSRRPSIGDVRSEEATRRLSDRIAEIKLTALERAAGDKGPFE